MQQDNTSSSEQNLLSWCDSIVLRKSQGLSGILFPKIWHLKIPDQTIKNLKNILLTNYLISNKSKQEINVDYSDYDFWKCFTYWKKTSYIHMLDTDGEI